MTRLALALALALAADAVAAETYRYRFAAGKPLTYKTSLVSEGSFTLPDGTPKTVKLAARSTVTITPEAPVGDGWRVVSQTTAAQAALDGADMPAPPVAGSRRTLTVRPDGSVSGADDQTFAIAFPDRAMAKGDRFTAERKASPEGLPLKTTYTLADTAATLPGYPGKLSLFEARSELARKLAGRDVTLERGGGKVWFDAAAGVLVKTELAHDITEGGRRTRVQYTSELVR